VQESDIANHELAGPLEDGYALKEIAEPDADAAHAATALVIGLIFITWFVRRQAQSSSPLIDFTLFWNPRFLVGILIIIVAMAG
jgi:DHA2 family multidrug resistance protein-like MFS transporter